MTLVDNKLFLKKVCFPFLATSNHLVHMKKHVFYIVKYQKYSIVQKIGFSTLIRLDIAVFHEGWLLIQLRVYC